jgi:hypothetical protein
MSQNRSEDIQHSKDDQPLEHKGQGADKQTPAGQSADEPDVVGYEEQDPPVVVSGGN